MKKMLVGIVAIVLLTCSIAYADWGFGTWAFGMWQHLFGGSAFANVISRMPQGVTFVKFYDNGTNTLNADYSVGSPTATFTASRDATHPSTYVDSNGLLQLVTSNNTPRYAGGYYDSTGFHSTKGLMVEAAGTNLLTNGTADSTTIIGGNNPQTPPGTNRWVIDIANGGAVTSTLSSDSVYYKSMSVQITNQGTVNTDITFRGSSAGNIFTIHNGTVYTVSFWVKSDVAKTIPILCVDAATQTVNQGLNSTFTTVAGTWIYVQKTFTGSNGADTNSIIRTLLGNNGLFTIQYDALQVEQNPYATSFIPTTTSALTRNAETLSYAISGNRTAASESIFVKFMSLGGSFANDSVYRYLTDTDTKSRIIRKLNSGTVAGCKPNETDNNLVVANPTTTPLLNTSYVVTQVCQHSSPYVQVYTNGTSEASYTTGDWTSNTWGTNFYMGSQNGGSNQLNGLIQKVAIFNRALSSTEVANVSNLL